MAKKPPPEHTRFKKGQSGNPAGRPKVHLTVEKLRQIIDRLAMMNREELQAVIQNPKTAVIELQIASTMAHAVKSGDYGKIAAILDRAIGKVKDQVEVTQKPFIITRPSGEQVVMGTEESKEDE